SLPTRRRLTPWSRPKHCPSPSSRSTGSSTRSRNMPNRRFDWHEHIRDVWGEYWSAREAVDRLKTAVIATPGLLEKKSPARQHLRAAHENLEGTYIVRLF